MSFRSLLLSILISAVAALERDDGGRRVDRRGVVGHAISVVYTELTVFSTSAVLTTLTETEMFTELRNLRAATFTQMCINNPPDTQTLTARPVTIIKTETQPPDIRTVETIEISTSSRTLDCIPTEAPDFNGNDLAARGGAAADKDAGITWTSGNVVFVTSTIVNTVTICPTLTTHEVATSTLSSVARPPEVTVCRNVQLRTTLTPTTTRTRTMRGEQKTLWSITSLVVTTTIVVPDVQPCTAPVVVADVKPAFSTQIIWG